MLDFNKSVIDRAGLIWPRLSAGRHSIFLRCFLIFSPHYKAASAYVIVITCKSAAIDLNSS
jgi:hypothetical protein